MDEIITMPSLSDGLSRGIMIAFLLCVLVCAAALIDMRTGIYAAKANKEKIMSHGLRKTVRKKICLHIRRCKNGGNGILSFQGR